mgnify:CR=1 FL=1
MPSTMDSCFGRSWCFEVFKSHSPSASASITRAHKSRVSIALMRFPIHIISRIILSKRLAKLTWQRELEQFVQYFDWPLPIFITWWRMVMANQNIVQTALTHVVRSVLQVFLMKIFYFEIIFDWSRSYDPTLVSVLVVQGFALAFWL